MQSDRQSAELMQPDSQLTLGSQTDSHLTLGSQTASHKVSWLVVSEFCIGFGQILIFVGNTVPIWKGHSVRTENLNLKGNDFWMGRGLGKSYISVWSVPSLTGRRHRPCRCLFAQSTESGVGSLSFKSEERRLVSRSEVYVRENGILLKSGGVITARYLSSGRHCRKQPAESR